MSTSEVAILLDRGIPLVPQELRPTAFAIATDVVFADGYVAESERAVLDLLQDCLRIRDDFAEKIIEVLLVKNQG